MAHSPAEPELQATWKDIAEAIKTEVGPESFNRWFKEIELSALTPTEMTLSVPNNIYQFWIESNYQTTVQAAALNAFGTPRAVRFVFNESGSAPARKSAAASRADKPPEPAPEAVPAEEEP